MREPQRGTDPLDPLGFLDARESSYPLAVRAFRALFDVQSAFLEIVEAARWRDDPFWSDAEARCHEILHLCGGDHGKFAGAVAEWVQFTLEFMAKQCAFLKSGRYASESFEAVRRDLYDDDEKMKGFYLIALMFSFLFSSNYAGFFSFFRRQLILRVQGARSVCDVGCGHGVYLTQMMTAAPHAKGIGVDISAASLDMSRRLLAYYGIEPARFRLSQGDIQERIPVDDASQDAVTCFEVIEHLERPDRAVAELRRILRSGGTLCMSTAIRMESVDHIHLFHSPEEVRRIVEAAGFAITEDQRIPLTTEDLSDQQVRERLIADPTVPLGIVLLAS